MQSLLQLELVKGKISVNQDSCLLTTEDISSHTIVEAAKQWWSNNKREDPIVKSVESMISKGDDSQLVFRTEIDLATSQNELSYIITYENEPRTGLTNIVVTEMLQDYDRIGVRWY